MDAHLQRSLTLPPQCAPTAPAMTSDLQSAACAPLDLSTNSRQRGRAAAPGTPERRAHGGDAPPARTDTHGAPASCAHKRAADSSSLKLPFRKRPVVVESHPPEGAGSPVWSPVWSAAGRPVWVPPETRNQSLDGYELRFGHHVSYGHYQMLCVPPPPPPEANHHLLHQPDHLFQASLFLATRQDEDGDTALHIAVVQGEVAIVCRLIQLLGLARRSPDIYNNLRQTPLHLAVITNQTNMLEVLLRAGADPSALDRNGQTALHLCSEYEQRDCLAVLLSLCSSSSSSSSRLEIRNYEGLTPLHVAVLRGHVDLARMLLNAGADINAMDIKSGQTPLMHAVESSNAEMLHFLIESGCEVNSRSYSGNTALHGACGRGQADTVRLLLKSGADSSMKNYHNDTPVMVAKNKKITDVLRGRSPKQAGVHDQHRLSASPHGGFLTENGSPSPSHSRGSSPPAVNPSAFYSPKTASAAFVHQNSDHVDYLHPAKSHQDKRQTSDRRT